MFPKKNLGGIRTRVFGSWGGCDVLWATPTGKFSLLIHCQGLQIFNFRNIIRQLFKNSWICISFRKTYFFLFSGNCVQDSGRKKSLVNRATNFSAINFVRASTSGEKVDGTQHCMNNCRQQIFGMMLFILSYHRHHSVTAHLVYVFCFDSVFVSFV
jgi:hypothetical protein